MPQPRSISQLETNKETGGIARAASLVGLLTLFSRIAGLVRDVVIGYAFGTGAAADAFFVAFRIPNLLRRFVAEGAMGAAFIPVFTAYLTQQRRAEAVVAARALATALGAFLIAVTVAGVLFAPAWVRLFAPGFVADAERMQLTVRLTQILFPYILLISLVALLGGLLHSLRHFAVPALSPLLLNLAIIGAALLLCPVLQVPVRGLAYGVLIGGVLQLALHSLALTRLGVSVRPLWRLRHPVIGRVARLLLPTLLGTAVYQVNVLVSTVLASVLPAGSVSFLWYASRVFEFPLGIFAVALGTAALPSFAAQAARGDLSGMRQSLAFAVRLNNLIALPASAGLLVLATPITLVLFKHGAFSHSEAVQTAWALQAFAVGLWPVSVLRLIVPVFYALGDTRTPVVSAALSFLANVALSLCLMGPIPEGPGFAGGILSDASQILAVCDLRHAGLALATSLAATVHLGFLVTVLSRRLGGLGWRVVSLSLLRSLPAVVLMVPAVGAIAGAVEWGLAGNFWRDVGVLVAAITCGLLVLLVTACATSNAEFFALVRLLRARGRDTAESTEKTGGRHS